MMKTNGTCSAGRIAAVLALASLLTPAQADGRSIEDDLATLGVLSKETCEYLTWTAVIMLFVVNEEAHGTVLDPRHRDYPCAKPANAWITRWFLHTSVDFERDGSAKESIRKQVRKHGAQNSGCLFSAALARRILTEQNETRFGVLGPTHKRYLCRE